MRPRTLLSLLVITAAIAVGFMLHWERPPIPPQPLVSISPANVEPRAPRASGYKRKAETKPMPVEPAIAAFDVWSRKYQAASASEKAKLVSEGMQLASARRTVLASLIRKAPEQALAAAVPVMARAALPMEVLPFLEERVHGVGDLQLLAATPAPGKRLAESKFHSVTVNGREFRTYSYGQRARAINLRNISIHGIALDGVLAMSDSPIRILEPGETANGRAVDPVCPVSGKTTQVDAGTPLNTVQPVAFEAGGKIHIVAKSSLLPLAAARLAAQEREHHAADNQPGTSGVSGRPNQAWTHGPKKVLLIRVDFSDKPGTPINPDGNQSITEDYVVNAINNTGGIRDFFEQNSYGKTTIVVGATVAGNSPDVTNVLRMPSTAQSYATAEANSLLHSDARALAAGAGFTLANYDRIGVIFSDLSSIPGSQIDYGGLANIEDAHFWVNGYFDLRVVAHELGHTYGLFHANLWDVNDGNPVSPAGVSVEYGDTFDLMGEGDFLENHFSHWNKSLLQWIPDSSVTTVTTGGTYRVHRFDVQGANLANPLALKIVRNGAQDYWIGHRRALANAALDNGAYILWGYNENRESDLLDFVTPNTNPNDSALQVGATFNDTAAGISFSTIARGGTGSDEWIDVQVTFQARIQFATPTFVADEQGGSAIVTLTRTNNSAGPVSLNYATSPGTATAPADYTTTNGIVSWANGDSASKTIIIPIAADAIVEGTEAFTVTLSGISGGVINGGATATVTIADPGANDSQFVADFINATVEKVVVMPDGKLLIGGLFDILQDVNFDSYTRGGIARMNADGTVDSSFGEDGGVDGTNDPDFDLPPHVTDFARQPDGKIIIVGNFSTVNGVGRKSIARLNPDGTLDTSFDPGTGPNQFIKAVLLQPDGKIVIGGYFSSYNGTNRFILARLLSNGVLDTGFVPPAFVSDFGWRVESLALQADGKILVGGTFIFSGPTLKASLCRVLGTNGNLDPAFTGVTNGAHETGSTGSIRSVEKIAVLGDGTILIAGGFTAFNNTARGRIAKLTNTGALIGAFAPTCNGRISALRVQPDGKILVGGGFTLLNGATIANMGRLTSGGANDTAFLAAGGHDVNVEDFAIQPDGRIVMGGDFGSFHGNLEEGPLWRFYPGLPGLPGVVQLSANAALGVEGTTLAVSATRTGGSLGALTVGYSTVPGTATAADFTATAGTLSWADGESTNKTISIPITGDALADSGESLLLNIGEPLIGSTILGQTQQATITLTTGFGAWQAAHFTPLEIANLDIAGDQADPDGDGRVNLLEYAGGYLPRIADDEAPGTSIVNVTGSNYLALTFRRRVPTLDLAYTVQNSGVLPPVGATAVIVGSPASNGDGTETVTFRDSTAITGAIKRFMRVMVQRMP